ncbi:MAG TPA: redoxin domain-containing protein [Candidatus Marinimicrobia bacterium]|jgi:peroxiredoxin|nr:redoxin domain-containing protein [Candidatus Neomarinimicrobiota bacterium]|tara:strand:- start:78 stop:770 length:693 start_codon:yes stop_codon:yes gene_type:complete
MIKQLLFFLLSLTIAFSQTPDDRGYIVNVGDDSPSFVLDFPDGSQTSLADLKGQVTMLQFTASWCQVCREEMPQIEKKIWKVYKNLGLNVIGIDRDEPADVVTKFAKEVKVTYPLALDPGADIFALFADRNSGVTRNIILGPDGKIVFLTRLFEIQEFVDMKRIIHILLVDQLKEEKISLAAKKQIIRQLKKQQSKSERYSIRKLETELFKAERELNRKERKLALAEMRL